jgi:hypothetical protein
MYVQRKLVEKIEKLPVFESKIFVTSHYLVSFAMSYSDILRHFFNYFLLHFQNPEVMKELLHPRLPKK